MVFAGEWLLQAQESGSLRRLADARKRAHPTTEERVDRKETGSKMRTHALERTEFSRFASFWWSVHRRLGGDR